MNKQMKQYLNAVLDAIVEDDASAAKSSFHDYLRLKTQTILLGEADDEDDKDEKKDKKEDKKSDKKDDEEKSDKKEDKKSDKKDDDEDCDM